MDAALAHEVETLRERLRLSWILSRDLTRADLDALSLLDRVVARLRHIEKEPPGSGEILKDPGIRSL